MVEVFGWVYRVADVVAAAVRASTLLTVGIISPLYGSH